MWEVKSLQCAYLLHGCPLVNDFAETIKNGGWYGPAGEREYFPPNPDLSFALIFGVDMYVITTAIF